MLHLLCDYNAILEIVLFRSEKWSTTSSISFADLLEFYYPVKVMELWDCYVLFTFILLCAKMVCWISLEWILESLLFCMLFREVFECSVLICFWRVRHAWHKNLLKRCSEMEVCAEIAKRLGQSVNKICKGSGTANLFKDIMEDFADAADFMDYYKANWYPRLGKIYSLKWELPHASAYLRCIKYISCSFCLLLKLVKFLFRLMANHILG